MQNEFYISMHIVQLVLKYYVYFRYTYPKYNLQVGSVLIKLLPERYYFYIDTIDLIISLTCVKYCSGFKLPLR